MKLSSNIILLSGPGHHFNILKSILIDQTNFSYINHWPKYHLYYKQNTIYFKSVIFFMNLIYFLKKIRIIQNENYHINYLFSFYNHLILSNKKFEIVWGFQMVSFYTFKSNIGNTYILEYAMNHVDFYMKYMDEEYQKVGYTGSKNSYFSKEQINKIKYELGLANIINVLSTFSKKTLIENGVNPNKINIMPLGIDTQYYKRDSLKKSNEKLKLLFVGRVEYLKGVHYLLESLVGIPENLVELTVAGGISDESKHLIKKHKKTNNVSLVGQKDEDGILNLYKTHDVLILPSIQESFGLVIIEAMACGLPVIATENSAAPDIIDNGEDGFIIPIRSSEDIREKIKFFIENKNLINQMSESAVKKINLKFSINTYKNNVLNFIHNIENNNENNRQTIQ